MGGKEGYVMSRGTGAEVVQEGTSCGSCGASVEPFTFRLEPVVAILEERFLTGDIDLSGAQPDEKHSLLSCRRS
ncbi:BnaC06g00910D [Brassica napus]|uniref:(rape) hypothetical protein n=1 Tax=Brassica napus TaxID=3708 RepID=A0A078FDY2_BRANA|nr:unnamed protein product [Brassica napus]CDY12565.1 BnaC06g00910D [Brassica napus]